MFRNHARRVWCTFYNAAHAKGLANYSHHAKGLPYCIKIIVYIRMSEKKCGCKPLVKNESIGSLQREAPTAHFFLSEEAYENDQGIRTAASTLGKYMVGGSFQKYINGTFPESWIYVKKVQEASGKIVTDDAWAAVTEESVPCLSSSLKKLPKRNCGENHVNAQQSTFRWNDAWLFVINLYKCQENDMQLYNLIKTICVPTFGYHCVSKQGGVKAGYVSHQFGQATHIMLMVSDCGHVQDQTQLTAFQSFKSTLKSISSYVIPSNACKFIVLGFAFLMKDTRLPKPAPFLLCNAMYYGLRDTGGRHLYLDVICSRFSVAQHMMHELLRKASENKIAEMVFGRKASFLCTLRAVPSVYTYYALMYGFTRTVDNRSVYPIFFVDADDIRDKINELTFDPPLSPDASNDDIMKAIFGEGENNTDMVWKAPPGCSLYRIYRLEAPFKRFLVNNGMIKNLAKRIKYFQNVQVFHGDDGSNGYIFSKLVGK